MVKKKVYVSSTYIDLQEHRQAVKAALERAGYDVECMEKYPAFDGRPKDKCLADVAQCDSYVLILALRYGFQPKKDNPNKRSITQLEYEEAIRLNKPCLAFLLDPTHPWPPNKLDSNALSPRSRIGKFRSHVQQEHGPRIFTTPDSLATSVLEALSAQKQKSLSEAPRPEPATGLGPELERYLAAVEDQHREIPLAGFKTKLRVPIDLEELYVPLQANVDLRGTGDCEFADAADAEAKLRGGGLGIPLIEAFGEAKKLNRKHGNLVILGDPGSGKTTHLKRLLLACLRQGSEALGLHEGTLPVFLPLRELADLSRGIDAFIEKTLDSPHLAMPKGFGKRLLERGRLLLLFDGLDEVSDPKQRAKVARWIEGAVKARPTCTAVVTCRFAGYDEAARLGAEFLELHLRPLTREQSETFIRRWYRAVETGLAPGPSGEIKANERAEELIERLKGPDFRSARMAEMTRNPLLLANLCLVHRDRGALPRGRHQLYDECIDVLLERWREGKKLAVHVSAETGRRVLQPAALWLHGEEGRTRARAKELAPVLEPALKSAHWQYGDARDFLKTIRDESGLLTGWGHDQYGFMHLGFQEYLAAC